MVVLRYKDIIPHRSLRGLPTSLRESYQPSVANVDTFEVCMGENTAWLWTFATCKSGFDLIEQRNTIRNTFDNIVRACVR